MNVPILKELVYFIEGLFKHTAPTVVYAVEQAAAGAAVAAAESDPKVQEVTAASIALLTAAKSLKAAIETPPAPAANTTEPGTAAAQ